ASPQFVGRRRSEPAALALFPYVAQKAGAIRASRFPETARRGATAIRDRVREDDPQRRQGQRLGGRSPRKHRSQAFLATHAAHGRNARIGRMADVPSAAPSSKRTMNSFLVTMAVGGFVSLLASLVTLVFSFRSIAESLVIAEDRGLDPNDMAARLKDS